VLRYLGNKGQLIVIFNDTFKLPDLKNPIWCKIFGYIS